jgi:hypothetical protein
MMNSHSTRRSALASAGLAMLGASLPSESKAAASTRSTSDHHLNVRNFGAKGDGKTDDTKAFQTALEAAHVARGGVVFVPPGRYLIASHLIVPRNVVLEGIFANISDNTSRSPFSVVNKAKGKSVIRDNLSEA